MSVDRRVVLERVKKMVDHGYETHRMAQKILHEVGAEIVNAIFDELEKPIVETKKPK